MYLNWSWGLGVTRTRPQVQPWHRLSIPPLHPPPPPPSPLNGVVEMAPPDLPLVDLVHSKPITSIVLSITISRRREDGRFSLFSREHHRRVTRWGKHTHNDVGR